MSISEQAIELSAAPKAGVVKAIAKVEAAIAKVRSEKFFIRGMVAPRTRLFLKSYRAAKKFRTDFKVLERHAVARLACNVARRAYHVQADTYPRIPG
jgi:hypothetical protein